MKKALLIAAGMWLVTGCGASDAITAPVKPAPAAPSRPPTLSLSMTVGTIDSGSVATVTATPRDGNGVVIAGGTVVWQSSDTTIARVISDGPRTAVVTALLPGSVVISASLTGITGTMTVTVVGDVARGVAAGFIYTPDKGMVFIPLPPQATGLYPSAINDSGQVVGEISFASGGSHAFLWSQSGGMKDLGTLPGATWGTRATAISPNGQVAGWGGEPTGARSFRWTTETGMVQLSVENGITDAFASGINDAGIIVGAARRILVDNTGRIYFAGEFAFRWSAAAGMEILKTPAGVEGAEASAINANGDIAGSVYAGDPYDDGYYYGAIFWPAGGDPVMGAKRAGSGATSLNSSGMLGGTQGYAATAWTISGTSLLSIQTLPSLGDYSSVAGINDKGTVVGTWEWFSSNANLSHGFFWSVLGGYHEIPIPEGRRYMRVTGVNKKDQIVGYVY